MRSDDPITPDRKETTMSTDASPRTGSSPLPTVAMASGASASHLINPHAVVEVASSGTGTTNDPSGSDKKP